MAYAQCAIARLAVAAANPHPFPTLPLCTPLCSVFCAEVVLGWSVHWCVGISPLSSEFSLITKRSKLSRRRQSICEVEAVEKQKEKSDKKRSNYDALLRVLQH